MFVSFVTLDLPFLRISSLRRDVERASAEVDGALENAAVDAIERLRKIERNENVPLDEKVRRVALPVARRVSEKLRVALTEFSTGYAEGKTTELNRGELNSNEIFALRDHVVRELHENPVTSDVAARATETFEESVNPELNRLASQLETKMSDAAAEAGKRVDAFVDRAQRKRGAERSAKLAPSDDIHSKQT